MGRFWDEDGFEHQCPGPPEVQPQAGSAIVGHEQTMIRLSCGHTTSITDPQTISWLSAGGDLSYRCPTCDTERPIVTVDEDATGESLGAYKAAGPSPAS